MSNVSQIRTYLRGECITFRSTKERFGGLSNMAGGYPIRINGIFIRSSEALYQACRFPHKPEIQNLIIEQHSPMTAKMVSKPYREQSRKDWNSIRVRVMRWCLRVKLAMNWLEFSSLLLSTENKPIVEDSRRDGFWAAVPQENNDVLVGMNVLGRLLMELREELRGVNAESLRMVDPPPIMDFLLFDRPLPRVGFSKKGSDDSGVSKDPDVACQPNLLWSISEPEIKTSRTVSKKSNSRHVGIHWDGEVPPAMWIIFYDKVVKQCLSGNLKLAVSLDFDSAGGVTEQQIDQAKDALRELGLNDELKISH